MDMWPGEATQCFNNLAERIHRLTVAINDNAKASNNLQKWIARGTIVMAGAIILSLIVSVIALFV